MSRINFSENILARGRKLHLQTNTFADQCSIVSTLFDGGRVLATEETSYDPALSEEALREWVLSCHEQRLESIAVLYSVSARVKTVRHPASLIKLGLQFLKWNLSDEAIAEFELALQYDAQNGETYLHLGKAYIKRGSAEEAIQTLRKGAEVAPQYADIWLRLAVALMMKKAFRKALASIQRALEINPDYDEALYYQAFLLVEILDEKATGEGIPNFETCKVKVKESLSRAVSASKRFRTPLVEEAMRRFHQGHLKETRELLKRVGEELPVTIDLSFHDAFYLNYVYGDKGRNSLDVEQYIVKLEHLIKDHPRFPDVHNMLGIAYLMKCRDLFFKSLQHFQIACEINPNYKKAKRNRKLTENDGKGLLILLRALLK